MDKFAALEPVKLYHSGTSKNLRGHAAKSSALLPPVGRLPQDLHLLILSFLPVPDFVAYSCCSKATNLLAKQDSVWLQRWKALGVEEHDLGSVLEDLEAKSRGQAAAIRAAAPPTMALEDDFGDFATGTTMNLPQSEMGDFVGSFDAVSLAAKPSSLLPPSSSYRSKYIRAHKLLKPLTIILTSPPHVILTKLSSWVGQTLRHEARTMRLLSMYLSSAVQPVRQWETLAASLRAASDRFDANLLAAFDTADGTSDEPGMREAASSSWEIWDGRDDWEMGKVWAEKREIFYVLDQWNALDNFT